MNDSRFASAFGDAASEYERGRPGYPQAAIDAAAQELGLGADSVVIDLAAGTGKLTRDLVDRFERVIAVEPLAAMREKLGLAAPRAEVLDGTAERIPVDAASADAVLAATAFHWFDGRRALDEIARVLRPGGGLGLLWNTTPWERRETPWFALLDDLLERSRANLSTLRRNASGRWRDAFEGEARFAPLAEAIFDNTQRMPVDEFLAGFASRSYVAALDPHDREALLADVAALISEPGAPVEGDRLVVPIWTACYWTRLTDEP